MLLQGGVDSPVVENIPPMMPQSRTRNCPSGMCCSLTVTIRELVSYFRKMPETPWLPAAWFISRSWETQSTGVQFPPLCFTLYSGFSFSFHFPLSLTRSVTENWCVSAEILCVLSLVGTTVMKYWNIWLSGNHKERTVKHFTSLFFNRFQGESVWKLKLSLRSSFLSQLPVQYLYRRLINPAVNSVLLLWGGKALHHVLNSLLQRLTVKGDFLCAVQRIDDARDLLAERQMVYSMGEVVRWDERKFEVRWRWKRKEEKVWAEKSIQSPQVVNNGKFKISWLRLS